MTRPTKVLLVEDNQSERELLARALRIEFDPLEVREVDGAEAFARALEAQRYDLAIVERRPSWSCGLKVGGLIRQRYPDCVLLMLAGDERAESAVEALRAGFDEFLPKSPGYLRRLPATIGSLMDGLRAQRREARTGERVQDLLGRLNVGIYRATSRGVMLYANAAFCRIFGIADWREAPSWSLRGALADPAEEARLARELRRTGMVQAAEVKLRGPGGRETWISLTQSLRAGTDSLGVIEGLVEDITERKLQAMAAKGREEEQRQARAMESVGRLAGGVAHDFNNLLTAINGYSELLLGALPRENAFRESVAEIRRAGSRAALLTRQLLAFSSRMMLVPRPLDLNGMLAGMEPGLRESLGKGVKVRLEPDPALDPVYMDPGALELVIQGVVSNAKDAMPAGGELRVQTAMVRIGGDPPTGSGEGATPARLMPGPYALLVIEDSGAGMDREVLARVFEPFFTTKPMGKGAGMGLSMAFGVMRQSGGSIHVDSAPGKGTRVRLYLPTLRPAPPGSPSSTSSGRARRTTPISPPDGPVSGN